MEMNFENPSHEWVIVRNKQFSVVVKHWQRKGFSVNLPYELTPENMIMIHHWNIYVNVFQGTKLYDDLNIVLGAPFHGGVTYEEHFIQSPAQGVKYDWQKDFSYYKIGCDYAHYCDEEFERYDGKDGIPWEIRADLQELLSYLDEQTKDE